MPRARLLTQTIDPYWAQSFLQPHTERESAIGPHSRRERSHAWAPTCWEARAVRILADSARELTLSNERIPSGASPQ